MYIEMKPDMGISAEVGAALPAFHCFQCLRRVYEMEFFAKCQVFFLLPDFRRNIRKKASYEAFLKGKLELHHI